VNDPQVPVESADHHYVPEFYLKGFMDKKHVLWVYEKGTNAPRPSTPKQEGHRENYYTFTDRGYADDSAEKMLSRAESMVAPTIRKLANPQFKMTDKQRSELYSFVALMFVRVPAYREFLDDQAGRMMKAFGQKKARDKEEFYAGLRQYESETGKPLGMDPEKLREFAMSDRYTVKQMSVAFNLQFALRACITIAEILDREYSDDVLYAPAGQFFLTCDNPIVTLGPGTDGQATIGMGFAWPQTEVVFPLNKRACMILSRRGQRQQIAASESRTKQINDLMMVVAQRYVYGPVGFRRLSRVFNERGPKIRYGENAFMSEAPGAKGAH